MDLQYASDLHLEFPNNSIYMEENPIKPLSDILLLGGDITLFHDDYFKDQFFDYISKNWKEVYMICGNHEFYNNNDLAIQLKPFEQKIRDNITLLNNEVVFIDNVKFIFSTLWSQIEPGKEMIIRNSMNDFRLIKYEDRLLQPYQYNKIHNIAVDFIKEQTNILNNEFRSFIDKTVVVTHHLPTNLLTHSDFKNNKLNSAFSTDLRFIEDDTKYNIDYWIYGHTHRNVRDKSINKTQFLSNQLGYVGYESINEFKTNLILTI